MRVRPPLMGLEIPSLSSLGSLSPQMPVPWPPRSFEPLWGQGLCICRCSRVSGGVTPPLSLSPPFHLEPSVPPARLFWTHFLCFREILVLWVPQGRQALWVLLAQQENLALMGCGGSQAQW